VKFIIRVLTRKWAAIELFDNLLADRVVIDAREAHTLGRAALLAHNSRRHHTGVEFILEQIVDHVLVDVGGQVGKVDIGGVLLALLRQLHVLLVLLELVERELSLLQGLEVDEAVALALARLLVYDRLC
jgi:hypothetical protein